MRKYLRATLLFIAALLMFFAAVTTTTVSVPHLREDLLEIDVRPTLLSAVMLGLYFGCFALFGFAALVLAMAIRALRAAAVDRILIAIIAVVYVIFGVAAFIGTGSHHMLGYLLIGLLLSGVVALRN
jgi:hypothetical protein